MIPDGMVAATKIKTNWKPKFPSAGMRLPRKERKYRKARYGRREAWKKMPAKFCP
jgi:hypothetical protein